MMSRCLAAKLTLFTGIVVLGCAPAPAPETPVKASGGGREMVSEWLPLQNDSVLEFDTFVEGTQERGRLVMQVRRTRGNLVELNVAGKVRRLEVKPEGVAIATGGWLLKQPFSVGSSFQGLNGRVIVTSVDRVVDVPAGHFTGCIETEEKTATTVTRTDYCRATGIARLVVDGSVNGEPRREIAELRFHGPRIDLGPEKTTAAPAGQ